MGKAISDHEVIDHGYMISDYFQGCGVCLTEFSDVATGCGSSRHEAYEDAVEQLATGGEWDVDGLPEARDVGPDAAVPARFEESYWYVSVRVR